MEYDFTVHFTINGVLARNNLLKRLIYYIFLFIHHLDGKNNNIANTSSFNLFR